MAKAARQGPLNPRMEQACVVVHNQPAEPMEMSPDEAHLSGIRMPHEGARARSNRDKGQRTSD